MKIKHYLHIQNTKVEILEPIGFDSSAFIIEQEKGRFGRDVVMLGDNLKLRFDDTFGVPLDNEIVLNNGVIVKHLNSGLELLLNENKYYGNNADVNYSVEVDGLELCIFNLDFDTSATDGLTYFECQMVQLNKDAIIKKRDNIKVDLLSNKDLDDVETEPIQLHKILLKSKTLFRTNKYENYTNEYDLNTWLGGAPVADNHFLDFAPVIVKDEISSALSPFNEYVKLSFTSNIKDVLNDFIKIEAQNTNTNLKAKIKITIKSKTTDKMPFNNYGYTISLFSYVGETATSPPDAVITSENLYSNNYSDSPVGEWNTDIIDIEHTIPLMLPGQVYRCFLIFYIANQSIKIQLSDVFLEVTSNEKDIDSVILATRYSNFIDNTLKKIGYKQPINQPDFTIGGDHYNNFVFSGNLIKQRNNIPFYSQFKDIVDNLKELCYDYETINNNLSILNYKDFYPNTDLGGFLISPDKELIYTKNEEYLINKFSFGYNKYEQDEDEKNTIDAIHTELEYFIPARNSINEKNIKIPFIRDSFSIEKQRRDAITQKETSTSIDDSLFLLDCIEIPPNTQKEYIKKLKHLNENGFVKLSNDNSFNWNLIGVNVGDTFNILYGANIGAFTISVITNSIITLIPQGVITSPNSIEVFTKIKYTITNVSYTNRTNEGLLYSENIRNVEDFSNLKYTTKRNILYGWLPYLATCGKFLKDKEIKTSYYKSNGQAKTFFNGEVDYILENENIKINEIADKKIINQDILKVTLVSDFYTIKNLLNNIKGFIRVIDNTNKVVKGYIRKLNFDFKTFELTLTLEVKNEIDFLKLYVSGTDFLLNEVGYDIKIIENKNYKVFNNYIQFFDLNNIPLCNETLFTFVELNGVRYDTINELINAIENV